VVGRGDHDGIDVLALDDLLEVNDGRAALVFAALLFLAVALLDALLGIIESLGDDVSDGDNLHLLRAEEPAQVSAAHRADADEGEVDAVVRRALFLLRQERDRQEWCCQCGTREIAPGETAGHGWTFPMRRDRWWFNAVRITLSRADIKHSPGSPSVCLAGKLSLPASLNPP
jgi:hypothetical protein